MNGRSLAAVAVVLVVALVIASQRRTQPQRAPAEAIAATAGAVEPETHGGQTSASDTREPRSPPESSSVAAPIIDGADEAPKDAVPAHQNLEELFAGIDPSLGNRNLIVPARESATKGPDLVDVEVRFRNEGTGGTWAKRMEAQITDRISRVSGLGLVRFDAECRETICRIKLFYPPLTNPLSSLERMKPLATELGFDDIVEAATIGDEGVPISLLYLRGL